MCFECNTYVWNTITGLCFLEHAHSLTNLIFYCETNNFASVNHARVLNKRRFSFLLYETMGAFDGVRTPHSLRHVARYIKQVLVAVMCFEGLIYIHNWKNE